MSNTLVREHFKRDGSPKRCFSSRAAALKWAAERCYRVHVYRCGFCAHWHLATARKAKAARRVLA